MKIQPTLLFLAISIYWTCLCPNIFAVADLHLDDQQSLLLQLKNSLIFKNESSSRLKLWNQSIACCHWIGVTCNHEGHVIGLDLSGESIYGGLDNSSSLFSLRHLENLNFAANKFNSVIPSTFNKLENLAYLNLSHAGFVGQIPIEISQLTRLVTLDLSSHAELTGQELKLEDPNLRKLVQNLTNIRQLYLDGVRITAQGQEWCNVLLLLPRLQELSLSNCNLSGPLNSSLTRLQNLSIIRLDWNSLSSPVPETFANFKNLTALSLAYSGLTGTFPHNIFQVSTLSDIDISHNPDLHGSFPNFPLNGSLQSIKVSYTSFSGALPPSASNMMKLSTLDLSNCQFNGTLPSALTKLREFSYLDLSFNNFTGPLPSFGMAKKLTYIHLAHNDFTGAVPSSAHFERLQNLIQIDLSYNFINGTIPSSLFTLSSLQNIWLSNNQFSQLDEFTNVSSSVLNLLDLSSNDLSGPIPASIFQLSQLSTLQLSSNKFNGSIHLNKFLAIRNLTTLDLSYNNLSVNVNVTDDDVSYFPNISNLKLASCNLKTFPGFLRYQSRLTSLDLSDNQIHGTVPSWLWKLENLESLNVSHNFLTYLEGPLQNLTSNLVFLDLHHNQLQGPIPVFPKSAAYIDYSSNNFSSVIPVDIGGHLSLTIYLSLASNSFHGSIPDSLCNASNLQVLDLSHNQISATVPSCLITLSEKLEVLNLGSNKLTGPIPNTFPASCALRTIDLNGNLLEGPLPNSLGHCTTLEVLDLGRNQIIGGFPCFVNNISTLRVLVLRNNKFHGPIGCLDANVVWHMLQNVDMAFNHFSGGLPGKWFTRWKAIMSEEDEDKSNIKHIRFHALSFGQYYQDSVTVISKGQQMRLVKILTVFTSIDFSYNQFEGPVPEEIMDFKALYVLNLSNNALSGHISSSIGNLKHLESLDLSVNSLEGEIPNELAFLNFLSFLNLSFNNLIGKIPTGTQLQSFDGSSFEGNDGLYGPPLTNSPDDGMHGKSLTGSGQHDLPALPACGRLACAIDWKFVSAELGLVFGLGILFFPLLFWKKWRVRYWKLVNKILCRIFPQLSLEYITHRGRRYKALIWRHY